MLGNAKGKDDTDKTKHQRRTEAWQWIILVVKTNAISIGPATITTADSECTVRSGVKDNFPTTFIHKTFYL